MSGEEDVLYRVKMPRSRVRMLAFVGNEGLEGMTKRMHGKYVDKLEVS